MSAGKYYIETYGCQMNEADSEVIAGILQKEQYIATDNPEEADIILINTCSVRQGAENRALARLSQFKALKIINPNLRLGLVGCVAQRDRGRIIEKKPFIDLVLGPDTYRRIPELITNKFQPAIDVKLSKTEVYDKITPFRHSVVNAWVSIMRGCDKFCSYCIVPFTRGRERSRSVNSILEEISQAVDDGFQEMTLLGQNVNSYCYDGNKFPDLLEKVAQIPGVRRIRFTSPHPADVNLEMLAVMRDFDNICKHIHLPLQSGSSRILSRMKRSYTQSDYLKLVDNIRQHLPACGLTTDIIVGFPGESDADFDDTLKVMEEVFYDNAYMFKYSPRPGTAAAKLTDDVPESEKADRLNRIIVKQKEHTTIRYRETVGTIQQVLIDGTSKKDSAEKIGRTDSNKLVILKAGSAEIGEIVDVFISGTAGVSLFGKIHQT